MRVSTYIYMIICNIILLCVFVLKLLTCVRRHRSYERTIGYACFNLVKEFREIGYKGKVKRKTKTPSPSKSKTTSPSKTKTKTKNKHIFTQDIVCATRVRFFLQFQRFHSYSHSGPKYMGMGMEMKL